MDLAALMDELGAWNHESPSGRRFGTQRFDALRAPGRQGDFFIAPKIIGGQNAKSAVGGQSVRPLSHAFNLSGLRVSRLGEDLLIEA